MLVLPSLVWLLYTLFVGQLRLMPLLIWLYALYWCIVCFGNGLVYKWIICNCVIECVLDFISLFAIFHREIQINPQISSVYWWISLINIVKSLDFLFKSPVFAYCCLCWHSLFLLIPNALLDCVWEEKLFHIFANSCLILEENLHISLLKSIYIVGFLQYFLISWRISVNPWISCKSMDS